MDIVLFYFIGISMDVLISIHLYYKIGTKWTFVIILVHYIDWKTKYVLYLTFFTLWNMYQNRPDILLM